MKFSFAVPTDVVFGEGVFSELPNHARACGKHAIVVCGSRDEPGRRVLKILADAGLGGHFIQVKEEPSVRLIERAAERARQKACDFVVSIGGGSVLDSGKAVAAMLTNAGGVKDYLEVVGEGKPLERSAAPHIAIPTTAGTGSEVTRNAVLAVPEKRVKVSMRSALMFPDVALVDPALTYTLPAAQTAASGLDAICQVLEPFLSRYANPFTDALCREGMRRGGSALRKALDSPDDTEARRDMALTSLFSGIALANAKLGAVHGIAGPLGGYAPKPAPHGAVCARLLPPVLQENLRHADPETDLYARFQEAARLLTGQRDASTDDLVRWANDLVRDLEIPRLREYGLTSDDFEPLAERSERSSSMKGNPVGLGREDIIGILQAAY